MRRIARVGGVALGAGMVWAGVAGCDRADRRAATPAPPTAEFLLATGDSTYWIRAGARGVTVRSSPLLLTWDGTSFHEIYVSDEDRAWPDAVFVTQRLWRRNLVTGDSLELARDSVILPMADAWAAQHRDVPPLDPDEPLPDEPQIAASAEFEVVDLHGPQLSWLRHIDVEADGSVGARHEKLWRVSDVRTGAVRSLSALFGPATGSTLETRAAERFAEARDSLARVAATRTDAARTAPATLRFDPLAFSLADANGAPRVIPMTQAADAAGTLATLALPALPVPQPYPAWWSAVAPMIPALSADSATLTWSRPGYQVTARLDPESDRLAFVLSASGERVEHMIGSLAGPAWSLIALDTPAVDSAARVALSRAFLEAQSYGDGVQQLARATTRPRLWTVAHHAPRPSVRRRGVPTRGARVGASAKPSSRPRGS